MAKHKNKHIREAIEYALAQGWTFEKSQDTFSERSVVLSVGVADSRCTPLRACPRIMSDGLGRLLIGVRTKAMKMKKTRDKPMSESIHRFTVILGGLIEMTDAAANALYEAGCDDGSPGSCEGVAFVAFDREAASLSEAIGSAARDVRKAGFDVVRVEIEAEDLEEWPDASSPANA